MEYVSEGCLAATQGIQHLRKAENIHLFTAKSMRKMCASECKLIFSIHTHDKLPSPAVLSISPLAALLFAGVSVNPTKTVILGTFDEK